MIDITCPKCGGLGRAPKDKVNTRLFCKKCRAAFYVSSSGRTLLGDPPAQAKDDRQRSRDEFGMPAKPASDWRDNLPEFTASRQSVFVSLGVLVFLGIGYFILSRPGESLEDCAKIIAQDFADGRLDGLKNNAYGSTADELVQWYGRVHPDFESRKKEWAGQAVKVGVLVIDENRRSRSGQVTAIYAPSKPSQRDASIHGAADVAGLAAKPMEVMFYFTPDARGRWRVDGKKMNEKPAEPL